MLHEQQFLAPVTFPESALAIGQRVVTAIEKRLGRPLTRQEVAAYGKALVDLIPTADVLVGLSRGTGVG